MAMLDAMINSLRYGSSVQKEVRGFFSEHNGELNEVLGSRIAAVCKAFKETSEREEIPFTSTEQEKKEYRKRVNNIINDVSRICREMIGYSIVNTKRAKGVYEYAAVKYEKPEKVVTEDYAVNATGILISRTECSRAHFDTSIHCVKPEPTDVLAYIDFFGEEGSPAREAYFWPSWTAEQFVAKMKANRAVKLEDVAKLILSELKAGEK